MSQNLSAKPFPNSLLMKILRNKMVIIVISYCYAEQTWKRTQSLGGGGVGGVGGAALMCVVPGLVWYSCFSALDSFIYRPNPC